MPFVIYDTKSDDNVRCSVELYKGTNIKKNEVMCLHKTSRVKNLLF